MAPIAIQQARHAARNIARVIGGEPRLPFRYRDKGTLATIGRASAVAEIRGIRLTGLVAWFVWLVVHIAYLIGFRSRLVVLIEWAWAYVAFERGARIITGAIDDPTRSAPR
jgi:NADH dehydrogenase